MRSLISTGPESIRAKSLRHLKAGPMLDCASAYRPGTKRDLVSITKFSLRLLARRAIVLEAEVAELDALLTPLVAMHDAAAVMGLGTDTASALLVVAGDNPERLRSEATFAHLCGVSPLDASSGKNERHRLNRGGDRQANSALWRIVITCNGPRCAPANYIERRMKEGLSKKEAFRCLKRYIAREVYTHPRQLALDTP